jgi:purine-nucleoside phosphorylase
MNVLAISLVTNQALPDGSPANHEEVMAAGDAARPRFGALLTGIVARL